MEIQTVRRKQMTRKYLSLMAALSVVVTFTVPAMAQDEAPAAAVQPTTPGASPELGKELIQLCLTNGSDADAVANDSVRAMLNYFVDTVPGIIKAEITDKKVKGSSARAMKASAELWVGTFGNTASSELQRLSTSFDPDQYSSERIERMTNLGCTQSDSGWNCNGTDEQLRRFITGLYGNLSAENRDGVTEFFCSAENLLPPEVRVEDEMDPVPAYDLAKYSCGCFDALPQAVRDPLLPEEQQQDAYQNVLASLQALEQSNSELSGKNEELIANNDELMTANKKLKQNGGPGPVLDFVPAACFNDDDPNEVVLDAKACAEEYAGKSVPTDDPNAPPIHEPGKVVRITNTDGSIFGQGNYEAGVGEICNGEGDERECDPFDTICLVDDEERTCLTWNELNRLAPLPEDGKYVKGDTFLAIFYGVEQVPSSGGNFTLITTAAYGLYNGGSKVDVSGTRNGIGSQHRSSSFQLSVMMESEKEIPGNMVSAVFDVGLLYAREAACFKAVSVSEANCVDYNNIGAVGRMGINAFDLLTFYGLGSIQGAVGEFKGVWSFNLGGGVELSQLPLSWIRKDFPVRLGYEITWKKGFNNAVAGKGDFANNSIPLANQNGAEQFLYIGWAQDI